VAARGAGQCSSRYGKIEDMLRSADCVLGTAERVTFTRRSGGPNPLGLMIGSEGTLGFVTRARLKVHAAPALRVFAGYRLTSFERGAEAMRVLMQAGLRPAVLRLYDPMDSYLHTRGKVTNEQRAERKSSGMPSGSVLRAALSAPRLLNGAIQQLERYFSASALMVVIFEGAHGQAEADAARAQQLLKPLAAEYLGEGPGRAWLAHRYAVSYRQSRVFQEGAFNDTLEVAAPWSRLAAVYAAVRRAAGVHALVLAHLSHAYPDGCSIYFTFVASRSGAPLARYDRLIDSALGAALSEGATLSHHHGVGASKARWLDVELGGGLAALRRVRRAWDPDALMNPGALEPRGELAGAEPRRCVPGVDAFSAIATFRGNTPLAQVEAAAQEHELSLGLVGAVPNVTLAAWIAAGLPGIPEPSSDPVLGHVCGLSARGPKLELAMLPAPRRAVGPDLAQLCVGARGEIADVLQASLALVKSHLPRAALAEPTPLGADEASAWQRIVKSFSK
jgi:alkyldihydroxyacetonephosphate synthase